MDNDNVPCFLCHDTPDVLYKLCECLESNVCVDCYNIEATQKMKRCAICRRNFTFDYKRNMCDFIKVISYVFIIFVTSIGIELFPPLYIYYYDNNENQIINNIFLGICLFSIIIGNILLFNLFKNIIVENTTKVIISLYIFKSFFIITMFFIVNYIQTINSIYYYLVFVIGVIYVVPFLFFSILIIFDKYEQLKNYINNKSRIRKIKIKSFIFQNHPLQEEHIEPQEPIQYLAHL